MVALFVLFQKISIPSHERLFGLSPLPTPPHPPPPPISLEIPVYPNLTLKFSFMGPSPHPPWNFQKPFLGWVWIFSETTHLDYIDTDRQPTYM